MTSDPISTSHRQRILVTGAGGFVGTAFCTQLRTSGYRITRALRNGPATQGNIIIGDIGPTTEWSAALSGADCVVHLVARAHVMRDIAADPLAEYRRINMEATAALARAAVAARVRRLIFLSSIKVNGERTTNRPFSESDGPQPEDAYGVSKWEAEQALWKIAGESKLEIVVLRAPLVYGPGVKGNFLRLMQAVAHDVPLPLASVHNRRSLIYVGNLATALLRCIEHPAAAGKTFLVADDADVSTPELIRAMATALGMPAWLLPFPPVLLRGIAAALGQSATAARLIDSLQVNSSHIKRELDWRPNYTSAQGLAETARWYHARNGVSLSTK